VDFLPPSGVAEGAIYVDNFLSSFHKKCVQMEGEKAKKFKEASF
jgi:hypothetical protein